MALRQSTLFNMDGGLWFKLDGGVGAAVSLPVSATRYTNLNDFQIIVPIATWNPNQWGDEQRQLNDSKYGFRIRESIFTSAVLEESPINDSALSPYSTGGDPNILSRTSVLYSYNEGAYLHIRAGWESQSPAQMEFAWVDTHQKATRFSNLLPIETILDQSILGDYNYGYGIEQYYFTKAVEVTQYNLFSGGPTGDRDIQRAFVPFSKERGQYLVIDDPGLPPSQMTFTFTSDAWAGVRFANAADFLTIVNGSSLSAEAYGWDLPQFYFNRAARPPKGDPFTTFWCDENNGPFNCIGYEMPTCTWLCREASIHQFSFVDYFNSVQKYLTSDRCYPNPMEFNQWWSRQDYGAFEQWLYQFWLNCGGQPE